MAQSIVLSGLVTKRSELAGRIKDLEAEIKALVADVKTLDGAIKIIDPSFNLRTIKAKRTLGRNRFFERGESSRFVLEFTSGAHRKPLQGHSLEEPDAGKPHVRICEGGVG